MVKNRILRKNARAQLGHIVFHSKWFRMAIVFAIPIIGSIIVPVAGTLLVFGLTGAINYSQARITTKNSKGKEWKIEELMDGIEKGFVPTKLPRKYRLQDPFHQR